MLKYILKGRSKGFHIVNRTVHNGFILNFTFLKKVFYDTTSEFMRYKKYPVLTLYRFRLMKEGLS